MTLITIAIVNKIPIIISKMHRLTHIKEEIKIFKCLLQAKHSIAVISPYKLPKHRYYSMPFPGGKRRLKDVK